MLKTSLPSDNSAMLEKAIAAVAAAMADPSRVKMLCALMDGRAWTATELSAAADVAPSTASGHLARLVEGQLITCLSQGRHRYYRLAGHDVAALVEQMMGLSWSRITPPETSAPKAMREARTCYDHLAGAVAVQIYDFMQAEGWLEADGSALTLYGREQFPGARYSVKRSSASEGLLRLRTGASGGFILAVRRALRCLSTWKAKAGSSGWRVIGRWW